MSLRKSLALSSLIAALFLLAAPVWSLTQIAPPDREMINRSYAIVVGTAISSYTRLTEAGGVETVTVFAVEDVLKGAMLARVIEIVEPGGRFGSQMVVIPGVPQFEPGERSLLMVSARTGGAYAVTDLQLGRFAFRSDAQGRAVLVRDSEPATWKDGALALPEDRARSAEAFLDYIRENVKGLAAEDSYFIDRKPLQARVRAADPMGKPQPLIAPYTATSYTLGDSNTSMGARWQSFPQTYSRGAAAEPGAPNGGSDAVSNALGAWSSAQSANISLQFGGVDSSHSTGLAGRDNANTVLFERDLTSYGVGAFTCSGSGYNGTLGLGGYQAVGTHTSGGETFYTIAEGDVEMNQGLANCTLLFNSGNFASAVTHEVGHSLSFRHADKDRTYSGAACAPATMECSDSAIMTAWVTQGISGNLQTWDNHAAAAVYPGTIVCNAPAISAVSASPTSIVAGSSLSLSVTASGTSLSYQWYRGSPGTTNDPVSGGNSASVSVSPTVTTTYWVRVSSGCGAAAADSSAVTVTVTCTNPSITTHPQSTSITAGQSATLTVTAGGSNPTYQWYTGTPGNTSQPVSGGTFYYLNVSPTTTTSYWVRVTACGTSVDSNAATVTVAACDAPTILAQPQSTQIVTGSSTQLSVTAAGTSITYQWYSVSGGITQPIAGGNANIITVSPSTTTNYFVRVSGCGTSVDSSVITVTVTAACTAPGITAITANPTSINEGSSAALSVTATGTSLSYQWYRGQPGDTSSPVTGGNAASVSVSPTATTTYWVRVSSGCGQPAVNSSAVTVTVIAKCSTPAITQPANQTIASGMATTITVAVTSTTNTPFSYAWYKGPKNDTSKPAGTSASLRTDTITGTAQYWVKVTNSCGSTVGSDTITISTVVARRRPARR